MNFLKGHMKENPFIWAAQVFGYSFALINIPLILLIASFVQSGKLSPVNLFVVLATALPVVPAFLLARKFYAWAKRL